MLLDLPLSTWVLIGATLVGGPVLQLLRRWRDVKLRRRFGPPSTSGGAS